MKLSKDQLIDNLKALGLVSIQDNMPISYSGFKNRASIHRYGNQWKIVFIGQPKHNLFGFYVMYGNDTKVMKEAYEMFVRLVKGDMESYENDDVQWGNCGIPIGYGNLRQVENNFLY